MKNILLRLKPKGTPPVLTPSLRACQWNKILGIFNKEHQWMKSQMQIHIHEVNDMFVDERKSAQD